MPNHEVPILRVLDAAANRAGEGLRVVEDCARFVLDDRHLTELLKQLRHELAVTLQSLPLEALLSARETQLDIGVSITAASELARADATAVVAASFKRIEQALRSLEEYGKVIDSSTGAAFEGLRYRVYTLERAMEITRSSADRLGGVRLYVLLDGRPSLDEFSTIAESLVGAGVQMLQLRDKQLGDRELMERARRLCELTRGSAARFVVNDRPDIARLAGAEGVHVGQEELAVKDARVIVGPSALVGASTHSLHQARAAVLDGANYIGVGPTFPSATKSFESHTGAELLRAVAAEISLPAFAIGGITLENLEGVLATGMRRVAVSAAIVEAADPAAAAREFLRRLDT
jgi:thiamine-phosphate pyrophosphorylase